PSRDFLQIARRADQSDTVGREEGVERMLVFIDRSRRRHSERSLFILVRNVRKARGVDAHAARRKVTPPSRNWSPATACPFFFAASRTASISPTRNVRPLMMSLAPLTKRKLQLGSLSSGSPVLLLLTGIPIILPQCSAKPWGSGLCISTPVK